MSSIFSCSPSIDEPIYIHHDQDHGREYPIAIGWDKPIKCERRIKSALMADNKDKFVNLVNGLTHEVTDPNLWTYMYAYDAVNCAAAILSGETSGKLTLEDTVAVMELSDLSPLHQAAWFNAVNIIKLFLHHGESADIRLNCHTFEYKVEDALPLTVALKSVWRRDKLNPICNYEHRVFKLIVKLCLSEKREHLESVRVLARNTKELDHEFLEYIKDGAMRNLCALFMVGYRVLPSSPLRSSVDKVSGNEELMHLLEIFDIIGHKLSAYIRTKRPQVVEQNKVLAEVSSLFIDAGLHLTSLDTSPLESLPHPLKSKGISSVDHFIRPWSHHIPAVHLEKLTVPRPSFSQASGSGYAPRGFSTYSALSFHLSTVRNPDTSLASSVDGKHMGNLVKNIRIGKQYAIIATALKRVGRVF